MPVRRSIFLVAAFAALLTICGGAAWSVWSTTRNAQANTSRVHERDLAIREALSDIRANVYLTAILARDELLDESPKVDDYREQFKEIQSRTDHGLLTLQGLLPGKEPEAALGQLVKELKDYDDSTEAILSWTPQQGQQRRVDVLRKRVGRRRDILNLTDGIETLTAKSSAEERALIEESNQYFRSSLGWIAGIALMLGAGVAGFTIFRIRVLEQQSETAESELRSLSGQLRTTQEDERKHLSRELHDQVGQMLTGVRMELAALSRTAEGVDPRVNAALERAKGNVEQTLQVVRNIAMLLRPSMLDDLGLTPALTWLAKDMARSSGIEIRRDIDPRVDQLPDAHRTCLYRIVQEALTNAVRHSGAKKVDLQVACTDGSVRVKVTDNGRGFDPAFEKRKGIGLLGMEERVRELGGQFHVVSVPGRGASVEILLPEPSTVGVN